MIHCHRGQYHYIKRMAATVWYKVLWPRPFFIGQIAWNGRLEGGGIKMVTPLETALIYYIVDFFCTKCYYINVIKRRRKLCRIAV